MRAPALLIICLVALVSGCTHHEIRTEGDLVILSLRAPQAQSVQFASSLDGFILHQARLTHGNTWEVHVPAGRPFSYFYLLDGAVFVPECASSEPDGFGSANCIHAPDM